MPPPPEVQRLADIDLPVYRHAFVFAPACQGPACTWTSCGHSRPKLRRPTRVLREAILRAREKKGKNGETREAEKGRKEKRKKKKKKETDLGNAAHSSNEGGDGARGFHGPVLFSLRAFRCRGILFFFFFVRLPFFLFFVFVSVVH